VTALDWLIVVFTAVLAYFGYLQGFVIGALSLLGFAAGAVLGTRFGPALLPQGSHSPYAPMFGLAGALLAGGVMASGLEGLGARLRRRLRIPGVGAIDGLLGAVFTTGVALGVAWIAGAVALQTSGPGGLRGAVRDSVILRHLNAALPPSGPVLNALARVDPLPAIRGPQAAVPAPTSGILADPQVRTSFGSVVRVTGTACGLGIEGSGWVAARDLVVTNAHVVAGEDDTVVQVSGGGDGLDATPVAFDAHDDIAVLRVGGLRAPVLPLAAAPGAGTSAAILGYPENGPFDARPARLGDTRVSSSQDAYGRGPIQRSITAFRGLVRSGNSGGPLVDGRGRVVATVFASTVGGTRQGGLGVPNAVIRRELVAARDRRPVDTGPCAR
jgi:hypothetical protein